MIVGINDGRHFCNLTPVEIKKVRNVCKLNKTDILCKGAAALGGVALVAGFAAYLFVAITGFGVGRYVKAFRFLSPFPLSLAGAGAAGLFVVAYLHGNINEKKRHMLNSTNDQYVKIAIALEYAQHNEYITPYDLHTVFYKEYIDGSLRYPKENFVEEEFTKFMEKANNNGLIQSLILDIVQSKSFKANHPELYKDCIEKYGSKLVCNYPIDISNFEASAIRHFINLSNVIFVPKNVEDLEVINNLPPNITSLNLNLLSLEGDPNFEKYTLQHVTNLTTVVILPKNVEGLSMLSTLPPSVSTLSMNLLGLEGNPDKAPLRRNENIKTLNISIMNRNGGEVIAEGFVNSISNSFPNVDRLDKKWNPNFVNNGHSNYNYSNFHNSFSSNLNANPAAQLVKQGLF